jgi:lysophospholipase
VVVSPGRSEPIEKYFEVVQDLLDRGFVVLVHDWRGQGLSHRALPDRLKGHAAGFKEFLGDYQALLAAFETRLPKPWIALGHSMGGCLTMLALATGESRFSPPPCCRRRCWASTPAASRRARPGPWPG